MILHFICGSMVLFENLVRLDRIGGDEMKVHTWMTHPHQVSPKLESEPERAD